MTNKKYFEYQNIYIILFDSHAKNVYKVSSKIIKIELFVYVSFL